MVSLDTVRTNTTSGTESRYAESSVRTFDQGRRDGAERDAPLSKEIRHHTAVQADLGEMTMPLDHVYRAYAAAVLDRGA